MNQHSTHLSALLIVLSLSACSSDGNTTSDTANENGGTANSEVQSGGGAGDTTSDTANENGGTNNSEMQTGGGAGDTPNGDSNADPEAVALVGPFTGTYALPGNWAGIPESEAYLTIQEPDLTGTAPVKLNRVNAVNVCIERTLSQGEAIKDPFSQRVFLNGLFDFENSVLSLSDSGDTLVIALSEDVNDIDDDNDTTESASLQAQRFAADLPGICEQ